MRCIIMIPLAEHNDGNGIISNDDQNYIYSFPEFSHVTPLAENNDGDMLKKTRGTPDYSRRQLLRADTNNSRELCFSENTFISI